MGSGRHAVGNTRGFTSILLVVALVAAVVGLGWVAFRPQDGGSADDCDGKRKVVISVVPAMQLAMERAVTSLTEGDECFPAEVRAESPDAVEDSFFNGGRPDLWVADTSARVDRLATIGINTTTLTPSLAMTPVGLVGGKAGSRPDSWIEAFESERVVYADPEVDSAAALTLVAPVLEKKSTRPTQDRLDAAVVLAAQNYGATMTEKDHTPFTMQQISATSSELVPVTEQELVTRGAGQENLKDLTPRTGAPALTFPLVKANGGAPDTDLVASKVREWFESQGGATALAEAGLRPSTGEAMTGRGFEDAKVLGETPSEEFNKVLGEFGVLSVPSSMLAVFDVSGSMDFPAPGGKTRMELAIDAALMALDVYPSSARIGLWAFSIDQGGKGRDYVELAPMNRLADETEGVKHQEYLRRQAKTLRGLTEGGTGLYDTVLAAYQKALDNYDKAYFNNIVILTDGANDDPGSASLKGLLAKLEKMQDPNRPVRIIGVGITTDADMESLQKISKVTGANSYLAEDPRDIMTVLARAMMSR